MNKKIQLFLKKSDILVLLFCSIALAINSMLLIASESALFIYFHNTLNHSIFYFIYYAISIIWIGAYLMKNQAGLIDFIQKCLLLCLPTEVIFMYGLQKTTNLSPYIGIVSAIYLLLLIILLVVINLHKDNLNKKVIEKPKKTYSSVIILSILMILTISMFFGNYNLGKMAIVDEPLWTFDRIPDFWKNLGEKDWYNSRVSDKPGLTVAVISGAGLLREKHPQHYENMPWANNAIMPESAIETFNYAFRLPIWIFVILMLPIFYLLLKKLIGQASAIVSIALISLSPVIIGNARIINPDSILWIFVSLAIISYLIYLRDEQKYALMLSALFLTLGILTKYTANILYFFFLVLMFAEFIFNYEKYAGKNFYTYLKKRLLDYGLLIVLSLALFYVLYPAVWEKTTRVFIGTIYSQAFEPIWPLFAGVIGFILADMLVLKNLILSAIVNFLIKIKRGLFIVITSSFLLSILLTVFNTYLDMRYFDFESILASPKSSFNRSSTLGFFLANFYPMIFGISIIALFAIFIFLFLSLKRKSSLSKQQILIAFYLLLFILVYYLGSVVSHVASIIRYQLVLFPIIFIIAGISLNELFNILVLTQKDSAKAIFFKKALFFIALLILLVFSLWQIKPFYMGYASILLPDKYFIDIKDMGEGSYEAASYLNSLTNPSKLKIWTDKNGVCIFFSGTCYSTLSANFFDTHQIDYFVVSSGRRSRTTKMSSAILINGATFFDIYDSEKFSHKVEIGGRSNNYVKIIDAKKISD